MDVDVLPYLYFLAVVVVHVNVRVVTGDEHDGIPVVAVRVVVDDEIAD